ncbi:hypothetical protein [Paractinoplanes durhamensis]|uniref:hypothetical protein n=1 Tax=Paractinoplanes durhamensis TaxID=113563 RepID=UPI001EF3812C
MTQTLAGDFDYDTHGQGYARRRQPDPRIAALIAGALGNAHTVLNVGAGAGSHASSTRSRCPPCTPSTSSSGWPKPMT